MLGNTKKPTGRGPAAITVPDDGLPGFESSLAVWRGDQGHFDALHWTYVRYDRDHPDRYEWTRETTTNSRGTEQ